MVAEKTKEKGVYVGSTIISPKPAATELKNNAFINCEGLTAVSMPNVATIGESAFSGCTGLTTVSMPLVTSLGASAFNGCKVLTTVAIEKWSDITLVGADAFNGCTKLKSMTFKKINQLTQNINSTNYKIDFLFYGAELNNLRLYCTGSADLKALKSDAGRTLYVEGEGATVQGNGSTIAVGTSGKLFKQYNNTIYWESANKTIVDVPAIGPLTHVYNGQPYTVVSGGTGYGVSGNTGTTVKDYTAKLALEDSNNSTWSDGTTVDKTYSWSITKATYPTVDTKWTAGMFTYDGKTHTVELTNLPAGVTVVYGDNSHTNAGKYTATVTLKYDESNYNKPANIPETYNWLISKKLYDLTAVKWTASPTYDGTAKTVILEDLPDTLNPTYARNVNTAAGTYTADVLFNYDSNNCALYNAPPLTYVWSINKATYDMSNAKWSGGPFTYDGTPKRVTLTGLPAGVSVASYTDAEKTAAGAYYADAVLSGDANYNTPIVGAYAWEIVSSNPKAEHSIVATAGAGGKISGPSAVKSGGSAVYEIMADAGYAVSDVTVDGRSVGAVSRYVFANVVGDHAISATFKESPGTVTVMDANGNIVVTTTSSSGTETVVVKKTTYANGTAVTEVTVTDSASGVRTDAVNSESEKSIESVIRITDTAVNGSSESGTADKNKVSKALEQAGRAASEGGLDGIKPAVKIVIEARNAGTKSVNVVIDKDSIGEINAAGTLTVESKFVSIGLDGAATSSMASKGGDLTLTLSTLEKAELNNEQQAKVGTGAIVSIEAFIGGERVHILNGWATVTIPYKLKDTDNPNDVKLWYVAPDGSVEKYDATYDAEAETVTASVPHFSVYAVVFGTIVKGISEDSMIIIAAALAALAIIAAFVVISIRRYKTAS